MTASVSAGAGAEGEKGETESESLFRDHVKSNSPLNEKFGHIHN